MPPRFFVLALSALSDAATHCCRLPWQTRVDAGRRFEPILLQRQRLHRAWLSAFSYIGRFCGLTRRALENAHTALMKPTKSQTHSSDSPNQPAAGKGMLAKTPLPQDAQTGKHPSPKDQSAQTSLETPNDRDQATDMTSATPDPRIEQAAKDVANKLQDTSKALETDRTYKKNLRGGIEDASR